MREQGLTTDPKLPSSPTVVGIGASAGGLAALTTVLGQIPADSGMAFVVVVHLSPDHKSIMADLLQSHVQIPVQQVTETVPLSPNNVYVIPPNANLSAVDTHLRLSKLEEQRNLRAPVDHFFRTLSETHDGHSVGVVLTGTGTDGTLGIRQIKSKGGIVIVQDPREAEFRGMPESAIASGMADLVLPLAEIPTALLRLNATKPHIASPDDREHKDGDLSFLPKILAKIYSRSQLDFSRYQRSSILRRVSRRMQLRYMDDPEQYVELLSRDPDEVRSLIDDFSMSATRFIHDRELLDQLRGQYIPQLFKDKSASGVIRVWTVACSTGEEVYSLAMLLAEEVKRRDISPRIQIFASDLNRASLNKAREGLYSDDIVNDVGPERLGEFFSKARGGYAVSKQLREMIVFAQHNLLSDPPFAHIDLLCSRNPLLSLDQETQRDVLNLFHYSLTARGILLVGPTETIDSSPLFSPANAKLRIFRKCIQQTPALPLPLFPLSSAMRAEYGPLKVKQDLEPATPSALHNYMLELYGFPSILVNPEDRVVHLSRKAGRYLVHPKGGITSDVFRLIREELRLALRSALQSSRLSKHSVITEPATVYLDDHLCRVIMRIQAPDEPMHEDFALILFEELESLPAQPAPPVVRDEVAYSIADADLEHQKLQRLVEEYQGSGEEMRSANEELQSANEELRTTMEELEASKEELNSVNAELQMLIEDHRNKAEQLAQISNDLQNLLTSTEIATLFLDRSLHIVRFTPKAAGLFHVLPTDRGRPISDLKHQLSYPEMISDAELVLATLSPLERQVADHSGRAYLSRVLPYRGQEGRPDGVVMTFVDITLQAKAEQALRDHEQHLVGINKALEQANASLQEFAYAASHDLREPLRTISAYVTVFINAMRAGREEVAQKASKFIVEGTTRMDALLGDLLTYAQLSMTEQDEPNVQVDLNEILEVTKENLKESIDQSAAEIVNDVLPTVHGMETNFIQLFQNLISNAIKYRSKDVPPKIRITVEKDNGMWLLAVRDNGIGIDPRYKEIVFGVFARLHKKEIAGTGIGLAICSRIVERLGGRIWVESELNQGSSFLFTLPFAVEEKALAQGPATGVEEATA